MKLLSGKDYKKDQHVFIIKHFSKFITGLKFSFEDWRLTFAALLINVKSNKSQEV
jgi:hypothetical protein